MPLRIAWTNLPRIAIDPGATCLAASTETGPIRSWLLPDLTEGAAFVGHTGPVEELAFSADGRWLASSGTDGTLRLWRTDIRRQAAQFRHDHERVAGVVLSADGALVAVQ